MSPRIRPPRRLELLRRHILNVPERADLRVRRPRVVEQHVRVAHRCDDFGVQLPRAVVRRQVGLECSGFHAERGELRDQCLRRTRGGVVVHGDVASELGEREGRCFSYPASVVRLYSIR